jgi:hypothetical protein
MAGELKPPSKPSPARHAPALSLRAGEYAAIIRQTALQKEITHVAFHPETVAVQF